MIMQNELKEGMTDNEIYSILHNKVAGEDSEQIQEFWYPKGHEKEEVNVPDTILKVIKHSDGYSIIRKDWSIMGQTFYYLAGINDEGMYFVHQIPSDIDVEKLTIQSILSYVNHEEEGFERVQGDVLCKFIRYDRVEVDRAGSLEYKGVFRRKIDHRQMYPRQIVAKRGDVELREKLRVNMFFSSWEDPEECHIFRNHKLIAPDCRILHAAEDRAYAIFGKKFKLKHNEHQEIEINIPNNMFALLMAQETEQSRQSYD